MRARRVVLTSGVVCLLALGASLGDTVAQQAPRDPPAATKILANMQGPVPIYQEPRHRVVFESGTTRIHDVQIPPGDTTLYHIHDTATLYVPISRSQTRSQVLGEDWRGGSPSGAGSPAGAEPDSRPGQVTSTTSYVEKPLTHRVNNIGGGLFRLIAVANSSKGSDLDSDDVSGLSAKPELVNRWYRAYRVSLAAGQSGSPHRHATPVVVVQQTAGRVVVEAPTKKELTAPGAFAWHDGSGTHQVRNVSDGQVELIEVEVRGAAAKP